MNFTRKIKFMLFAIILFIWLGCTKTALAQECIKNNEPVIYDSINIIHNPQDVEKEYTFEIIVDELCDGIRLIEDNGDTEDILIKDSDKIEMIKNHHLKNRKIIVLSKIIHNAGTRVLYFKPLNNNIEGKSKSISFYVGVPSEDYIPSLLSLDYPMEEDIHKYIEFEQEGQSNIDPIFLRRLAALARDNGEKIIITSGYRSYNEQVKLFKKWGGYKNRNGEWVGANGMAAVPGRSWHQFGEAVDVSGKSAWLINLNCVENTDNQDILLKYGLFKPFTRGNKGIIEKWHIQPIETNSNFASKNKRVFFDAYNTLEKN